ncbi:MAG: glycosyltransferase [Chitinophagaceae bacterium]
MLEQLTFFIGMLPLLFRKKPSVFYLGEYKLYCYLFKFRSLFNLNYSLVLYTGGQAAPGLFDHTKDFVHHVTDVYLPYTRELGIPASREFIIPHYVDCTFTIDSAQVAKIRSLAGGKSIFLSVGIIDSAIKRMDLIPKLLFQFKEDVFVILLGRQTDQTPFVLRQFETLMPGQFIYTEIPHKEIGNYYAAADYLIQCSRRESFGYMYVEALSANLTVITHDFPEARYVLEEHALFVDMNKPEHASVEISEFVQTKKRIAGAAYAANKYSWETVGIQYTDMFRNFVQ